MLLGFNKKSPETAELEKKLLPSKNSEVFALLERKCFLTASVNSVAVKNTRFPSILLLTEREVNSQRIAYSISLLFLVVRPFYDLSRPLEDC